jgi:hypothetical protein
MRFIASKTGTSLCVEAVAKNLLFKFLISFFSKSSDHNARLQSSLSALMFAIYMYRVCIYCYIYETSLKVYQPISYREENHNTVRKYQCFSLKYISYIRSFLDPGCQTIFNKLSNLYFNSFDKHFPRLISLLCIIML